MLSWLHYQYEMERYGDYIREARKDRLLRQLRGRQDRGNSPTRRGLARLGTLLIAWGVYLQRRYGVALESPACRPKAS